MEKKYIAALFGIFLSSYLSAQHTDLSQSLHDREFTFHARTAQPARGQNIQLTSYYDLRIHGDSLVAYLPYYGRAYTAPIGNNEGGIQFTSTNFSIKTKDRRKGGWEIDILPKGQDVREMILTVSENGYSNLSVTSSSRDFISFYGDVTVNKKN
jgi:hypothetical protein